MSRINFNAFAGVAAVMVIAAAALVVVAAEPDLPAEPGDDAYVQRVVQQPADLYAYDPMTGEGALLAFFTRAPAGANLARCKLFAGAANDARLQVDGFTRFACEAHDAPVRLPAPSE